MREGGGASLRIRNADGGQQAVHLVRGLLAVQPGSVQLHGFGQLAAHALQGVQGGHGVLEHHGQVLAAEAAHLGFGQPGEVPAAEQDPSGGDPYARWQQVHDGQDGQAFSGAGFAHQGEHLVLADVEGDAVHQPYRAVVARCFDGEVLH